MLGKKVLNNLYWHIDLTTLQPVELQRRLAKAEALSQLTAGVDYNIVKYDLNSPMLSLLWYPDFFTDPFPALETSYRIDLDAERVEKRSYQTSINPPILHRKELFIRADDPRSGPFKALTQIAEELGLFENPIHIGFKQAWEKLIADKGFQLLDHQFVPHWQ
jgi:DNA phosphorothioation-associated putative methyltransferase